MNNTLKLTYGGIRTRINCIISALVGLAFAQSCNAHVYHVASSSFLRIAVTITLSCVFGTATYVVLTRWISNAAQLNRWIIWVGPTMLLFGLLFVAPVVMLTTSDTIVLASFSVILAIGFSRVPYRTLWPVFVIVGLFDIVYLCYNYPGALHAEAVVYMLGCYLSKRPWLDILFDPCLEGFFNRSRPLSLLFDFIDYRFVYASVKMGYPLFYPLTHLLFCSVSCCVAYYFFVIDLKIRRVVSLLLIVLYLLSPTVSEYILFRSAKSGAAMMLIVVFTLLYRMVACIERERTPRIPYWRWIVLWLACMCMSMFDETGTYCIAICAFCVSVYVLIRRTPASLLLFGTLLSVLLCAFLYKEFISSLVYGLFNNGFHFKKYTYINVASVRTIVSQSVEVILDSYRWMYGNCPRGVAAVLWGALIVIYGLNYTVKVNIKGKTVLVPGILSLMLAGVTIMLFVQFAGILYFHAATRYVYVYKFYYTMPIVTMMMLITAVGCKTVSDCCRWSWLIVAVLLAMCVIGNIYALPFHHSYTVPGYRNNATILVKRIQMIQGGKLIPRTNDSLMPLLPLLLGIDTSSLTDADVRNDTGVLCSNNIVQTKISQDVYSNVTYLADMQTLTSTNLYTGKMSRYRLSDGRPLLINFTQYSKGIFTHAPIPPKLGVVTCPLGKKYKRFRATVGVMTIDGSVSFLVRLDGKEVFKSNELSAKDFGIPIDIDVTGAECLELCVDPGLRHEGDWGIWGDPRLLW